VAGSYNLWVLCNGYGGAAVPNIQIGNGNVTIPDSSLVLSTGSTLSGKLLKVDGTAPSEYDANDIIAIRNGFEEILVGNLDIDASGTILGYSMTGFKENKAYSLLIFNEQDETFTLASNLIVNNTMERNFVLTDRIPEIFTQASKGSDGKFNIQFEFTKSLRNSEIDMDSDGTSDDNECGNIITVKEGAGSFVCDELNWLSSDRSRAIVQYTPAAGESTFRLTVQATFNSIDPTSGANYSKTSTFTYYAGISKSKSKLVPNAAGANIYLEGETGEFQSPPGAFVAAGGESGSSADLEVEVEFRAADNMTDLDSSVSMSHENMAVKIAKTLGFTAYPREMASAINKIVALDIDPFSSFYDVLLPASVSHYFPNGKEAKICLAYDDGVDDPYSLNIYYYNTETDEYLIENENKFVDVDNKRICANISHASVFTILDSSASIISGGGYTGELAIMNFPNPFNLKSKTVTLQNPGSNPASQTIEGTMIKLSVPASISGSVSIEIYNVTGEKVRTIHSDVVGGSHYYINWDGKNDHGEQVASGVYIGHLKIAGGNEKFFKMAVLK